jgi:hypothetical protein
VKLIIIIPVIWFISVLVISNGPQLMSRAKDRSWNEDSGDHDRKLRNNPNRDGPLQPPDNKNLREEPPPPRNMDQQVPANRAEDDSARQREQQQIAEENERQRKEREKQELKFVPEKQPVDPNAPGEL